MRIYFVLAILFGIGLFLRTWNIGHTFALTYDIGRDLKIVEELSQGDFTLVGPAVGGLPGVFLGPLTYYYALPFFILTKGHPLLIVALHGLVSALLIPLVYLINRKLGATPTWSLLLTAWFTVLSGPLDQARVLWNPSLTPLLLVPLFACLLWARQRPLLLIVAAVLLGLSLQTQLYTVLLAPVFGGWILYEWFVVFTANRNDPQATRNTLLIAGTALVLGGATFLPQLLFEVRHGFNMTRALLESFSDDSRRIAWTIMMENRPKVLMEAMSGSLHSKFAGLAIWWLGFVYAGLGILSKRLLPAKWLLALLTVPLIFFFTYTGNNGYFFNYYLESHYVWIFFGVVYIIANLAMSRLEQTILGSLIVILAISSIWYYTPITQQNLFSYTFNKQLSAWQTIYDHQTSDHVTVEVFTPNLLPVQYEYINTWYARSKQLPLAEFNQNLSGNKEVYLLYEAPFAGGSSVAFEEWSKRQHQAGQCVVIQTIGIITVEKCRLNES